ncbi:unnamed protein product [Brassica rapa]|uniref:Uncharacterized protein n=2 Tax=Brassica TaxID=3705 RepID=A0A8D9HZ41_BRACM|nr:unnamed protein product [Brassica napus]CAG7906244.1 unnamed protein product [Brassica rapa]
MRKSPKGIQNVVRVRCAIQTISRKIRVLLNTIILFNIHFIASLGQNVNVKYTIATPRI